jgi:hypothetical protein
LHAIYIKYMNIINVLYLYIGYYLYPKMIIKLQYELLSGLPIGLPMKFTL